MPAGPAGRQGAPPCSAILRRRGGPRHRGVFAGISPCQTLPLLHRPHGSKDRRGAGNHLERDRPRSARVAHPRKPHEIRRRAPRSPIQRRDGGAPESPAAAQPLRPDLSVARTALAPSQRHALTTVLRDTGLAVRATVGGFRSSFRDLCAKTGKPRELTEAALAHVVAGIEGAHFRSDLIERRRQLMSDCAQYLTKQSDTLLLHHDLQELLTCPDMVIT